MTLRNYGSGQPPGGHRRDVRGPLSNAPAARMLVVIVLAAVLITGGVYALGRGIGAGTTGQPRTAASAGRSAPDAASSSANTQGPANQDAPDPRPPLPPEPDGPFGSRMTTGTEEVALTFDDGPDPTYTPQTLAVLRHYGIKATFCVIGTNVQAYPDLVRAIVADGHTLCNHTWSHDLLLGGRSPAVIRADLTATTQAIQSAAPGAAVKYFRQPGGNWSPNVVAVATALGMTPLHWAVDPQDWTLPGPASIATMVTGTTVAGSVVLLHDGGGDRQGTVNALQVILPNLIRRFQLEALPTRYDAAVYERPPPSPDGPGPLPADPDLPPGNPDLPPGNPDLPPADPVSPSLDPGVPTPDPFARQAGPGPN